MASRIYNSMLVVSHALFPVLMDAGKEQRQKVVNQGSGVTIPPRETGRCLAGISRQVRSDGLLSLFFPGCMAFAAPFLLFRLKREGFSCGRAVVTADGLLLTARR